MSVNNQIERMPSTDYLPYCLGTEREFAISFHVPNSPSLTIQAVHLSGVKADGKMEVKIYSWCGYTHGWVEGGVTCAGDLAIFKVKLSMMSCVGLSKGPAGNLGAVRVALTTGQYQTYYADIAYKMLC